jgi:hypothetical protein
MAYIPTTWVDEAPGASPIKYKVTDDTPVNASKLNKLEQAVANILSSVYPIGCIYTSVVSTNPATLFGFGTWVAFATGRTLVGYDSGQAEFDVIEETGGAKTHTLITAEMPSHKHTVPFSAITYSSGAVGGYSVGGAYLLDSSFVGSGSAHNNLQPYIVVYMWKRTA